MERRGSGHGICGIFAQGSERSKCGRAKETERQSGGKAGSAKRGAKYFAGNWRDCEQGQYPWVLAARRHMAIVATVKTEIARRERGMARKRARDLLRICAGEGEINTRGY